MSTNQPKQKGMSPYTKYKKRPFIYSDELNNWTAAIKKGDKASADRFDLAWRKRFAPETLYRPKRNRDDEFFLSFDEPILS